MMRLQKFLSQAGVASRRKAEELILAGKVKVNGQKITELGTKVDEKTDQVEYAGRIIRSESKKVYIAVNKPVDYVCSVSDKQGKSVLELVDISDRIYPVGRLDKDSSGLIILTNDGDFANRLAHPRYGSEKEYAVLLNKKFAQHDADKIARGIILDGKKLQPVKTVAVNGFTVRLVLREGVNRQIRRMLGQLGYRVLELKRIRIGHLSLGNLKEGEWKKIKPTDL